jgi:hypothetical protein
METSSCLTYSIQGSLTVTRDNNNCFFPFAPASVLCFYCCSYEIKKIFQLKWYCCAIKSRDIKTVWIGAVKRGDSIRDTFQVWASIQKHHGIQIRIKTKSVSSYPIWRYYFNPVLAKNTLWIELIFLCIKGFLEVDFWKLTKAHLQSSWIISQFPDKSSTIKESSSHEFKTHRSLKAHYKITTIYDTMQYLIKNMCWFPNSALIKKLKILYKSSYNFYDWNK